MSSEPKTRPRWTRSRLIGPGLALASLLLTFGLLEAGTRALKWEWRFENFLVGELSWFWAAFPAQQDPLLGWTPRPGQSGLDGSWGESVLVLDSGVRSNGSEPPTENDGPILAVGDSFTWGAEVADSETWPALLEQQLGRRVVNGGVFGYGVDQIYLRARRLMDAIEPSVVVFSFISDDIDRCEMAVRAGTGKPYFTLDRGEPRLHAPEPGSGGLQIGPLRRLSGYSFFVYKLLRRTIPQFYLTGGLDRRAGNGPGYRIACALLAELAATVQEREIRLFLVLQDGGRLDAAETDNLRRTLDCIRMLGVPFLDLRSPLLEMARRDPDRYAAYFTRHMTREGNAWVAEQIAGAL